MRYLVTGATGFVGAHVVKQLLVAGHGVNAVVRSPAKASALADFGVKIYPGDVADKASLRAPMDGVDGVFHIAGWYKVGVRDKSQARPTNVDGTRNVLETMRELGIAKGVYTSTLAIFSDTHGQKRDESYKFTGKHFSVYEQTKAEAHAIAEGFIRDGLPLVIVQPGLIYGPGDTSGLAASIQLYLHRRLPVLPLGTTFCWAHVDDVARGHLLAMEKGKTGETYIIAGPCHRLTEFFELAQEITGVPAPKTRMPPRVMRAMAGLMSVIEKVAPVPEIYTSEYLRVNGGTTYMGDNAKARRELGYNPRPLREGAAETLKYEMERLKSEAK